MIHVTKLLWHVKIVVDYTSSCKGCNLVKVDVSCVGDRGRASQGGGGDRAKLGASGGPNARGDFKSTVPMIRENQQSVQMNR